MDHRRIVWRLHREVSIPCKLQYPFGYECTAELWALLNSRPLDAPFPDLYC
eukprot:jgi/Botrbrau1/22080/Bobra.0206s0008.1